MRFRSNSWLLKMVLFMALIVIAKPLSAKIEKDQENEYQAKLEEILLNKRLTAKVTFPASKDGIDLKINGEWDNKKVTGRIKDRGIGIDIDEYGNSHHC